MGVLFGRKTVATGAASQAPAPASAVPDPLFNGLQYVGAVAPPGTFVEGMTSPLPCQAQSGTSGIRFAITTRDGPGFAFFFPDFASIWLNSEPAPRPEIPTEMIDLRTPGYWAAVAALLKGA